MNPFGISLISDKVILLNSGHMIKESEENFLVFNIFKHIKHFVKNRILILPCTNRWQSYTLWLYRA